MSDQGKFNLGDALNTFFVESREMLEQMEDALLDLEKGSWDQETLNVIFRAAHTIKGSSGMFDLSEIEEFTHALENMLDEARNGNLELDSDKISLLLKCTDNIGRMLDDIEHKDNSELSEETKKNTAAYFDKIRQYIKSKGKETGSDKGKQEESESSEKGSNGTEVLNECWHISLRCYPDFFRHSLDPLSILNYLQTKGEIVTCKVVDTSLPALAELDPEFCYLGFEIDFKSILTKPEIEDAFEFVSEDSDLYILSPKSTINEYIQLIEDLPEEPRMLGELLYATGTLTQHELDAVLNIQCSQSLEEDRKEGIKPFGEIVVDNNIVHKKVVDAALKKQEKTSQKRTVRLDADKLDELINLVGELVVSGSNLRQYAEAGIHDQQSLKDTSDSISRLIEEVRNNAMDMRMVQIGSTFKRYERVVRDLSLERNKEAELVINGGEAELDRNLVEKISDPLMHLVRNAIDHGIDMPEAREIKGKPRKGVVSLNAFNEAGNIVIEVVDDGDGLDREKIYAKGVAKGFIEEGTKMSDHELYQLVFEPGFSTAEKITNISGRGVGMDVVKRNIENLRGSTVLRSEAGKGTTVQIHLPLTLAIIDGFMVQVGKTHYIIPLGLVLECSNVTLDELNANQGVNSLNLRGEALPYLNLREFFDLEGEGPEKQGIVVINHNGMKAGIVVDSVVGEFQTVIKPLGKVFHELDWISGGSIYGRGEVAFILDVQKLLKGIQIGETITGDEPVVSDHV